MLFKISNAFCAIVKIKNSPYQKLILSVFALLFTSFSMGQISFEEVPYSDAPFIGLLNSATAFSDIDNDNDMDILMTGTSEFQYDDIRLYTNDGTGKYTEVLDLPIQGKSSGSIAFSDIDNDSDPDVVITGEEPNNYHAGITRTYINDGVGNYSTISMPFINVAYSSIAFADIDNDNDQDILISGLEFTEYKIPGPEYKSKIGMYINDGDGNFSIQPNPFQSVKYSAVAFADIDGDNDQDVIITGYNTSKDPSSKIYVNDGLGNFTEVTELAIDDVLGGSVAFADIDGDNDLDLFIAGRITDFENPAILVAKIYLNNGMGNFSEVEDTPFVGFSNGSAVFADFDNDNDLDLIVAGIIGGVYPDYNSMVKVYENDGTGTFTEVLDTPFDPVLYGSLSIADIDGDNDQDVLITGLDSSSQRISKLYRNSTFITGIFENSIENQISIYPNPNTGMVNIDLGGLTIVSVKIMNVTGQTVYYKENINTPVFQLELNKTSGIYIIEISSGKDKKSFRLVKQ